MSYRLLAIRLLSVCLPALCLVSLAAAQDAPAEPVDSNTAPAADPAQTYELRYRFTPNQFVHYRVTHTSRIITKYEQASETTFNESTTLKHFRVTSSDRRDGTVLEPVIDHVKMTVRFGEDQPIEFDSNWDLDDIPLKFRDVKRIVGQPLARVRVNEAGRLDSIVRLQATQQDETEVSDAPDNDPSRNFLVELPEEPVKIGDTWSVRYKVHVTIPSTRIQREVELLRTYALKAVEDDIAVITQNTSVVDRVRNAQIRAQLIQREPSGTVRFDMQRGLVVSRESDIDETVFEPFGPKSSMRAISQRVETLIDAAVARKEAATTTK